MKLTILTLLATLTGALAGTISGTIPSSPRLPHPSQQLPSDTAITLTTAGTVHRALLRRDASFVIRGVKQGSYLLETECRTHVFAPLRVDVGRDGAVAVAGTFRGGVWGNLGEKMGVPIELVLVKQADYYVLREGFNLVKMLSSPMILIAIVSLVSIVFLPKLMDKMDPEFKAELAERQKESASRTQSNPVQSFDAAGWLAGTSSTKAASPPAVVEKVEKGGRGGRR